MDNFPKTPKVDNLPKENKGNAAPKGFLLDNKTTNKLNQMQPKGSEPELLSERKEKPKNPFVGSRLPIDNKGLEKAYDDLFGPFQKQQAENRQKIINQGFAPKEHERKASERDKIMSQGFAPKGWKSPSDMSEEELYSPENLKNLDDESLQYETDYFKNRIQKYGADDLDEKEAKMYKIFSDELASRQGKAPEAKPELDFDAVDKYVQGQTIDAPSDAGSLYGNPYMSYDKENNPVLKVQIPIGNDRDMRTFEIPYDMSKSEDENISILQERVKDSW